MVSLYLLYQEVYTVRMTKYLDPFCFRYHDLLDKNEKNKKKYAEDVAYRLKTILRARLNASFMAIKANKMSTNMAMTYLGCSLEELKNHLEKQFKEGMEWSNHGTWHIDHIIGLFNFDITNVDQVKVAFHYTNLRPLWKEDNLKRPKEYVLGSVDNV